MFIMIACQKLKIIEDLSLNKGDIMKRCNELKTVEQVKRVNTNTYSEEPLVIMIYSGKSSVFNDESNKEEVATLADGSKLIFRVVKFRSLG